MTRQSLIRIDSLESLDVKIWDSYVHTHPEANAYQLSHWLRAIEEAYGHKACFVSACKYPYRLSGILPLVCMRGLSLKKELVSTPFCDLGGVLADDSKTEAELIRESLKFAKSIGAKHMEFRQSTPVSYLETKSNELRSEFKTETHKVRMVLTLPASSDALFSSFKSKLRSQIRRPEKSGLYANVGGMDLLADFYSVFVPNMRDLGSPVHSRRLMEAVIRNFEGKAKIVAVYKERIPVAASIMIGCGHRLANPWASALRDYGRFSPNMLLYWTMLKYGCDHGYTEFDFGRSTPGEGTYKFKKQWGAKKAPLNWYHRVNSNEMNEGSITDQKSKLGKAIEYWSSLPAWMTKTVGPVIRKHISL